MWDGPASLVQACDQLCHYLTWRDCKASIIIFNKHNARFSELLEKVGPALVQHPRFVRSLEATESGEWRIVLRSQTDDSREITVHVFLFDLFVGRPGEASAGV